MVNFLEEYENGVFLPYLNGSSPDGGILFIEEVPFGEEQASQRVSDELQDEQASIYSLGACLERKIEIRSVQRASSDQIEDWITLSVDTLDFGSIDPRDFPPVLSFQLQNTGRRPITLTQIQADCGCTAAVADQMTLDPGAFSTIEVQFDPIGKSGVQEKSIFISIDQAQNAAEIRVKAFVE